MAEKTVLAYGEGGQLLPTPESEVLRVPVVGTINSQGSPITPRFARLTRLGDGLPDRIRQIEQLTEGPGCRVTVWFATPFVGLVLGGEGHMRDTVTVLVFNEADARDPYFARVPPADLESLLAAIRAN